MIKFAEVTQQIQTGTVQFTSPGFGTPSAVIFISSGSTAVNTTTVDTEASFMIGFADGTNQGVVSSLIQNRSSGEASRRGATDECIMLLTTGGSVDGEASFSKFVTDGVEVIFGNALSSARYITAILIGGEDVEVVVDTFDNTSGDQNYSSLDWEPTHVFLASNGAAVNDAADTNAAYMSFGIGINDGAVVSQHGINHYYFNRAIGGLTTQCAFLHSATAALRDIDTAGANGGVDLKDFDEFGLTFGQVASAGTQGVFLALRNQDPGYRIDGGSSASMVGIGSDNELLTESTPAFDPGSVFLLSGYALAGDTVYTDANANGFSIGFATSDPEVLNGHKRACHSFFARDGITGGASVTRYYSDHSILRLPETNGLDTPGDGDIVDTERFGSREFKYFQLSASVLSDHRMSVISLEKHDPWVLIDDQSYFTIVQSDDDDQGQRGEVRIGHGLFGTTDKLKTVSLHTDDISGTKYVYITSASNPQIGSGSVKEVVCGPFELFVDTDGSRYVLRDPLTKEYLGEYIV